MFEIRELTIWSVLLRVLVAAVLSGAIGLERGMKNRPAGLRTYMLVCIGACIVMITNQYIFQLYGTGDIVRMGAQVISGIGFLGAGTIIVTTHNRIKGLTTAAALWTCACIGLAIGIGFYEVALIGAFVIVLILTLLHVWDTRLHRHAHSVEIYVELDAGVSMGEFLKNARAGDVVFASINLQMAANTADCGLAFLATVKGKKRIDREELVNGVRVLPGVRYCEEM